MSIAPEIITKGYSKPTHIFGLNPQGVMQSVLTDGAGNLNVNVAAQSESSLTVGTASLNSSSSSPVTLIAAGATGIYNNIASLVITNESSTATVVSLADGGGNTYKFAIAANGGISYNPNIPLPQGTAAQAWSVSNSAAVTLDFVAIYFAETVSV